MADTRDKVGRAGVFLAGGVFKTAVYIFIIVFPERSHTVMNLLASVYTKNYIIHLFVGELHNLVI